MALVPSAWEAAHDANGASGVQSLVMRLLELEGDGINRIQGQTGQNGVVDQHALFIIPGVGATQQGLVRLLALSIAAAFGG